ncbi:hypothetical protein Taro_039000 [Colocasia esculenta]|uniref:Uncharacterized protein n=1 Tax=Colocasia esculenta TaxID=4460 RepID=A0A843W9J0_COLES|nr:hypothetical protein [Colocasia esculenta]
MLGAPPPPRGVRAGGAAPQLNFAPGTDGSKKVLEERVLGIALASSDMHMETILKSKRKISPFSRRGECSSSIAHPESASLSMETPSGIQRQCLYLDSQHKRKVVAEFESSDSPLTDVGFHVDRPSRFTYSVVHNPRTRRLRKERKER